MQPYSPSSGHKLYGKEITAIWVDELINMDIKKEIFWVDTARKNSLSARTRIQPRGFEVGINEQDIDPIQQWCEENNCGKRVSFDTFQFKTNAQKTMFLLKWS
jgi:hypothetical protein